MKKMSTFFYSVCNFNDSENDLFDLEDLVLLDSGKSEFSDVYKLLNKVQIEPDSRIVQNVIDYSKSYDV